MAADPSTVSLDRIGQILIPVADLERAVAFYRDHLGMTFLYQFPNLAFFDCGGVRLLLEPVKKGAAKAALYIHYFQVVDLERVYAVLVERGVSFTDQPHIVHQTAETALWMAFFKDSEGNTLALMEERPKL